MPARVAGLLDRRGQPSSRLERRTEHGRGPAGGGGAARGDHRWPMIHHGHAAAAYADGSVMAGKRTPVSRARPTGTQRVTAERQSDCTVTD